MGDALIITHRQATIVTIEALNILTQVMSGFTLLALLWLTARAFRINTGWGLGVLLLSPVTAVAFGIRHWNREKFPFLLYMGTFTVTLVLLVSLFTAWGGWELVKAGQAAKQSLQNRTLTQNKADAFRKASLSFHKNSGINYTHGELLTRLQRELDRNAEKEQIDARAAELEAQEEAEGADYNGLYRRAPKETARYRLVYKPLKVADAHRYIGSTVKVTRRNVEEKEYRLTGVSGGSLKFAQKNGKGSFSFAFKKRDIEKIRILTKEPY